MQLKPVTVIVYDKFPNGALIKLIETVPAALV